MFLYGFKKNVCVLLKQMLWFVRTRPYSKKKASYWQLGLSNISIHVINIT